MTTSETRYEHIVFDESNIPHISGTTMKVVELVMAQKGNRVETRALFAG